MEKDVQFVVVDTPKCTTQMDPKSAQYIEYKHHYAFPTIRGMQAGRPFYLATCPLRVIPELLPAVSPKKSAQEKAQRSLNLTRVPQLVQYLLTYPKDYIFPTLTASISGRIQFQAYQYLPHVGTLYIPYNTPILINDGQHRRTAIEQALKENPQLGQDTLPILFFIDEGLERSQQVFTDLNKFATKPSASLSILYDHRDSSAQLTRQVVQHVPVFHAYTEMEKSSLGIRSDKLFTLNSLKHATLILLGKGKRDPISESDQQLAISYWQTVAAHIPHWQQVQQAQLSPAQLRTNYIHAHGIGLQALGLLGKSLIEQSPSEWPQRLSQLEKVDWHRSHRQWQQRSMSYGKLTQSLNHIRLTSNALKMALDVELSPEEQALEKYIL